MGIACFPEVIAGLCSLYYIPSYYLHIHMKTRHILAILLLSLSPLLVNAQYKLSDKPDEFMADVTAMMASSKSPEAIKAGQEFESIWSTRFSDAQKVKTISIAKKMVAKRYKPASHFQPFFKTVAS